MKNNTKIIIVAGAFILFGLYSMNKKKKSNVSDSSGTDTSATLDLKKVLSKGTVSPEVGELQKNLGQLAVDDIFGVLTQARLKAVTGKTSITLEEYYKLAKK
jgi:hypothetical protein